MRKYLLFFLVTIIFAITGCQEVNETGTEGNFCYENSACDAGLVCQDGQCLPTEEITPKTIVITTQEANNDLIALTKDELTFVKTPRNEKFEKDQIIAFQKNDKFKGGLVARIKSIKEDEDVLKIKYELVNPFLAIGKAKLEINRIVTEDPDSPLFIPTKEQIQKFKNLRKDDISYTKTRKFPFEKSWKGETLKFKGSLDLKYLLEATIDIDYPSSILKVLKKSEYRLNEFEVKNTFKADVDATLDIFVEKDAGFKTIEKSYSKTIVKDLSLAKFPIALPISGIQFMGNVELSLKITPEAKVQGKAHVEAYSHNTIKANLHYINGHLDKSFDFDTDNSLDETVTIEGNASITLNFVPVFKITANAGILGEFAKIEFGTEVNFTPVKLEATLKQHAHADNSEFGITARACLRADAELSLNPYAEIGFSFGKKELFSKKWNADRAAKVKGWSWLDFMTPGGYLGSSANGCHSGLVARNGKCRASEFWSVVGQGKDGLKCIQLACNEDKDCQLTESTKNNKCIAHLCRKPEDQNNGTSYEMVTIPEGDFTRGCVDGDETCKNSELPAETVHISEFKIGKKEVTIAQYNECVNAGKCKPAQTDDTNENHPVTGVTWREAYNFCNWAGQMRLPTEAEWEYAAKGTTNNKYVWGNEDPTCDLTVMENEDGEAGCGEDSPADVGSKSSDVSPFGVMDLAGNVSEWTGDLFDPSYYKDEDSLKDPRGPKNIVNGSYVTVRGGAWFSHDIEKFRNSNRQAFQATSRTNYIGFRCAKSINRQ